MEGERSMDSIWTVLGLEATRNISSIKRAYAQKTKICHPEEDPEGFLELRNAYQAAVDYAERGGESSPVLPQEQEKPKEEKAKEEEEPHDWIIPEELPATGVNPFCDGEAIRKFVDLYTGQQRKNSRQWMNYFTSDAFLDAAWDGRFTALLLKKVTEVEHEFPLNKEVMMWLGIVYLFFIKEEPLGTGGRERKVMLYQGAEFPGIESIVRIAAKGPLPKRAGGDELAVLESFKDYRHLVRMAEGGSWNEQAMEEFQWIVGRYSSAYLKEGCDPRANPDYQRHPAGLRIITHFFQRMDLPEELYRIVWQKYDLKNAATGRMKMFYVALWKLVTERIPEITEEMPENFFQLNQERAACFARIQANPQQEREELENFFSSENVRRALRSRRFIEEQLLSYSNWLNSLTPEGVVCWLKEFYKEHQDIPGWNRVVERAEQELDYRAEGHEKKEEEEHAVPAELDLSWLLALPERVYVQPLAGSERVFRPERGFGADMDLESQEEENPGVEAEEDWKDAELLTKENFLALFDCFAEGKLERLELNFSQTILVLTRDKDDYACFCFETGYDTWYSMLSEPEVYQAVDSKDVEYLPFGMGKLAKYSIYKSPAAILRNLNLVFMQIGRERIYVRVGDCWIWASHTSLQNSSFKKRMAMQKLAKIPACRAKGSVLEKFVFSKHPAWVESMSLSGERTLTRLQPGNYDLAVASLTQFFWKKLAKLRLSWEPKGQEGAAGERHMVLLFDGNQFMMAWLLDGREQASFYASDTPRVFYGHVYPACLVHQTPDRIRNCLNLILDDMDCAGLVTDRQGEFVLVDCPYAEIRKELVEERI